MWPIKTKRIGKVRDLCPVRCFTPKLTSDTASGVVQGIAMGYANRFPNLPARNLGKASGACLSLFWRWVAMGKRWLPLESNPDVLNSFAKGLGFDTSTYAFCDIYGLDEVQLFSGNLASASPRCRSFSVFQYACRSYLQWCPSLSLLCYFCFQSQINQRRPEKPVRNHATCILHVLLKDFIICDVRHADAEDKELRSQDPSVPKDIFYMKQTIGNACGTIGLLHSIGNSQERIQLGEDIDAEDE